MKQRRRWGGEEVEWWGQGEAGETAGRWPTEVGKVGAEPDRVGRRRGQLWVEEIGHQSATAVLQAS